MNSAYEPPVEFEELLQLMCEGELTDAQARRLETIVEEDEDACWHYLCCVHLHGTLHWNLGEEQRVGGAVKSKRNTEVRAASGLREELQGHAAASSAAPRFPVSALPGPTGYFASGWPLAYLVATVIFAIGLAVGSLVRVSGPTDADIVRSPDPAAVPVFVDASAVARITGMVDCQWDGSGFGGQRSGAADQKSEVINHKSLLHLGDRIALKSGLMEITYEAGAKVILQGPVTYEVESAAGGYLAVGKLTAKLEKRSAVSGQRPKSADPKSEIGNHAFAVRTPTAIVTDLGTEFGVSVGEDQRCELKVFQGRVVLQTLKPTGATLQAIELGLDEAACVQSSGAMTRYERSTAETSRMAAQFARELPHRAKRMIDKASTAPNPIDSMPGLLYHLDAAHGVTVDGQGCVRIWADQSTHGNDFVRRWNSTLAHVAHAPSFNGHPVVRNTTTTVPGLCLWRETSPRSLIVVQSTAKAGRAGGMWGYSCCGVRRANPGPSTGWVWTNANTDDFALGGGLHINGVASHLQEYNAPGILEAYGPNPREPVFQQTEIFGYTQQDEATASRWWEGDIAEIMAFDRVLIQSERASILQYLGEKYKIAVAVPSSPPASSPSSPSPRETQRKENTP